MSEMIERVAIAMWCDYVRSASPPVEFHARHNLKYWLEVASERDRIAWRRSARIALATIEEALK